MGIIESACVVIDLVESHFVPGIEIDVVEHHHELLYKIIDFSWWLNLSGD